MCSSSDGQRGEEEDSGGGGGGEDRAGVRDRENVVLGAVRVSCCCFSPSKPPLALRIFIITSTSPFPCAAIAKDLSPAFAAALHFNEPFFSVPGFFSKNLPISSRSASTSAAAAARCCRSRDCSRGTEKARPSAYV